MKRCVWLNDDDEEELMLLGYIVSHGKKKIKKGAFSYEQVQVQVQVQKQSISLIYHAKK